MNKQPQRKSFDERMAEHDREMIRMQRFVKIFFIFVCIMMLLILVSGGTALYKANSAAGDKPGLKPVIESLWCGEPGCMK